VQNKAKETPETGNAGNGTVASTCVFISRKGSKTMQYNAINKHVTFICVFLIKQALLSSVTFVTAVIYNAPQKSCQRELFCQKNVETDNFKKLKRLIKFAIHSGNSVYFNLFWALGFAGSCI